METKKRIKKIILGKSDDL